ncbi:MAG: hypothetical protein E6H00_07325 [Bacillati bacterium ANGP1]|uniref:LysE family translocator n=1 Tax=Candidatus Segetimicrobium genomatis TaxID=2569760 RepID=A0A537K394_9BACT|nr:MAG: hypothetical protein E6H00_07325 [Terrabacteria group bacterium ANGP1]
MDARFIAYLVVSAILIVTPGPDMALVARNAVSGGYSSARSMAFGVGVGILLWGIGLLVARAAARFGPGIRRALDGAAGAVMVGLAVERR